MNWIPLFKETVFLCLWQENNDERDILNYFILLPEPHLFTILREAWAGPHNLLTKFLCWNNIIFSPSPFPPPFLRKKIATCCLMENFWPPLSGGEGKGRDGNCLPTYFQWAVTTAGTCWVAALTRFLCPGNSNWRVSEDSFPTPCRIFRPVQSKIHQMLRRKSSFVKYSKNGFMQWWA